MTWKKMIVRVEIMRRDMVNIDISRMIGREDSVLAVMSFLLVGVMCGGSSPRA
jgi:hypothetical protein